MAEVVVAILEDEDVDPYVDVDLIEADIVPLRKASGNIGIVDIVIASLKKCWEKFGRPEWAQLSDSSSPAPCGTPQSSSCKLPRGG